MRFISPLTTIPATILVTTFTSNISPVLAQQLTQITDVNVRETEQGSEIILETADGSTLEFVEQL